MSLRDMIKRLWKARANKIEIPENKLVLPDLKKHAIVGVDYGTGGDETALVMANMKSGKSTTFSKITLNQKKLQTQWDISSEMLGAPAEPHKTIEEALRHRHVKSKRLTQNNIFDDPGLGKALMKNLTDQIAADIDTIAINGTNTQDDITLDSISTSSAVFTPRVLTNIPRSAMWGKVATDFKKRGHDSIEAALRMRHRKDDFGPPFIEAIKPNLIQQNLVAPQNVQAMIRPKFFPMLDIDTAWLE